MPTMTLGDLMRYRGEPADQLDVFHRWRLGRNDPDARVTAQHLAKTWARWPTEKRELLLRVAEWIAKVEKAKAAWNPKTQREAYKRVARAAVAAARLAEELCAMFPPPWKGDRACIGVTVAELASFMKAGHRATSVPNRYVAALVTADLIDEHRGSLTGRAHWELLRDLAWLASGKRLLVSERTIRRYLERRHSRSLAAREWAAAWPLVRRIAPLASGPSTRELRAAVTSFLRQADR